MQEFQIEVGMLLDGKEVVGVKKEEKITTAYLDDGNFHVFNNSDLQISDEKAAELASTEVSEVEDTESSVEDTEPSVGDTEPSVEEIDTDMGTGVGTDPQTQAPTSTETEGVIGESHTSTDPETGEDVTI